MKKTCVIAAAIIGLALAAPVTAHHPSPNSDLIEDMMPADALDAHNAAVDSLLESGVADMGVSANTMDGTVNGVTDGIGEMDPANDGQGATCADIVGGVCDDGGNNEVNGTGEAWGGMTRSPAIFPESTP